MLRFFSLESFLVRAAAVQLQSSYIFVLVTATYCKAGVLNISTR